MSPTSDSTPDKPQEVIADLRRHLVERTAERDEAQRKLEERTSQLDEALQRETATAEVLQIINSSPGDLAPVFDAMLDKATRLCEASFGIMQTYDGQRLEPVARHGVPAALVEWSKRNPLVFGPGTAPARIVGGEDLVHTIDLMTSEAYQRGDPSRRALVDLGGARSHLIVALRKEVLCLARLQSTARR